MNQSANDDNIDNKDNIKHDQNNSNNDDNNHNHNETHQKEDDVKNNNQNIPVDSNANANESNEKKINNNENVDATVNNYGPIKGTSTNVSEQRFDPTGTTSIADSTPSGANENKTDLQNVTNNNFMPQTLLLQQQLLQQQLLQQQSSANASILNTTLDAATALATASASSTGMSNLDAMQGINNPLMQQLLLEQLKQQQQQFANPNYLATDPLYQSYLQANALNAAQLNAFGLNGLGGLQAFGGLGVLPQYTISSQTQEVVKHPGRFYPFSLFIFHLPPDIDNNGLLQLFLPYGAVACHVMRHQDGSSRGFGFVYFNNQQEAIMARDMMNGYQIGSKRLKVSIKRGEDHMIPPNALHTADMNPNALMNLNALNSINPLESTFSNANANNNNDNKNNNQR